MSRESGRRFLAGMTGGVLSAAFGGLALLYVAARTDYVRLGLSDSQPVPAWFAWIDHNLGLSLPVFVIVFFAFHATLNELSRRVARHDPPDRIAQMDHLTEIWTGMFFGTGVIWTAIGMRNALLFALGDPVSTVDEGAMVLLERMVDGGILVALSTTIFGGIGGYLMRVIKSVTVGAELRKSYAAHGRADAVAIRASLDDMNRNLQGLSPYPSPIRGDLAKDIVRTGDFCNVGIPGCIAALKKSPVRTRGKRDHVQSVTDRGSP